MDIVRQFQNLSWCTPDWCYPSMSRETNELLQHCATLPPTENFQDDVEELIKRSRSFPIPFPIDSPRLEKLKETRPIEELQRNIRSTYPLIHARVLLLMTHFLIYKREFGTVIEKQLYKDMTIPQFIDRLLKKRAVVFMGEEDKYKLLSGEEGEGGWESIGQPSQRPPLTLASCLSYDEMKLSSMVYVSGHTACINDGGRFNEGKPSDAQPTARIIGLIGPRFERRQRMEYEDVVITEDQNCESNGYGEEVTPTTCLTVLKTTYVRNNQCSKCMWRQIWAEFYQVHSYTFEELIAYVNVLQNKNDTQKYTDRYIPMNGDIFNNEVYYKRIRILAECALLEADSVAAEEGTSAYLNVIGCGLGVWKISSHQNDVYMLTFLERVRNLLRSNMLQHVTDVNFAYIRVSEGILAMFSSPSDESKERKIFFESKKHPHGGITVTIENRSPSSPLTGPHSHKLLVMTYPWDSNAHPGNEFWLGSLSGSGDPAAACSTQVAELHNAHINPRVSGYNVRVAGNLGIKPLAEYCSEFIKT